MIMIASSSSSSWSWTSSWRALFALFGGGVEREYVWSIPLDDDFGCAGPGVLLIW